MNLWQGLRRALGRLLRHLPAGLVVAALAACAPDDSGRDHLDRPMMAVYSSDTQHIFALHQEAGVGGSVARLSLDGQIEEKHWLRGLGPEAVLAAQGEVLYVADGAHLRRFDVRTGAELETSSLDSAHLGDVAVDAHGLVHVLDRTGGRVLRLVGGRTSPLLLPSGSSPIAIASAADALWILLRTGDGRGRTVLLRRSIDDDEHVCPLGPVSAQATLLSLERDRIGLFDPETKRLQRFDRDCRPLLHWRIAAGPVRLAQIPGDHLVIPEPESGRIAVTPTPDRLLADAPKHFQE